MTDWSPLLADMEAAKRDLAISDVDRLWRHEAPQPPASPSIIAAAQSLIDCELDSEYADFLLCANGWPAILQDIDLFGTEDFRSGGFSEARELLNLLEPEALAGDETSGVDLFPIGASRTDIDILAMPLKGTGGPAPVIWIAGLEVERFSTFSTFFRAMIDHNLKEAEELAQNRRP
ncbi:SMI1/KNR4 family protein [Kitasatospora sp. MAA4]|uniref:SMI1/KNR4 family protein n=1 Tax=Kitasatospora sp. MAA4 TaxID=3035093 RepID=UPI0032AF3E6E